MLNAFVKAYLGCFALVELSVMAAGQRGLNTVDVFKQQRLQLGS